MKARNTRQELVVILLPLGFFLFFVSINLMYRFRLLQHVCSCNQSRKCLESCFWKGVAASHGRGRTNFSTCHKFRTMNPGNARDQSKTGVLTHFVQVAVSESSGGLYLKHDSGPQCWCLDPLKPFKERKFRSDSAANRSFYFSNEATLWTGLSLIWHRSRRKRHLSMWRSGDP